MLCTKSSQNLVGYDNILLFLCICVSSGASLISFEFGCIELCRQWWMESSGQLLLLPICSWSKEVIWLHMKSRGGETYPWWSGQESCGCNERESIREIIQSQKMDKNLPVVSEICSNGSHQQLVKLLQTSNDEVIKYTSNLRIGTYCATFYLNDHR